MIRRFELTSRWVHALTGGLVLVCVLTAAVLYNRSLATRVGHRHLVAEVHTWCGLACLVPVVLGALSRSFRDDLRRLNRFSPVDWAWLRSPTRRDGTLRVGKFNAGQKLNAALSAGALGALLLTGVLMRFTGLTRLSWRSGATFAHDWFALGLGLLVLGHLRFALADAEALRGIRTGLVGERWARREHAAWADELTPSGPPDD